MCCWVKSPSLVSLYIIFRTFQGIDNHENLAKLAMLTMDAVMMGKFKIDNGNYENALAGKANAVMMGVMMMNTAMTNNLKIDNYENVLVDDWGDGDDIYIMMKCLSVCLSRKMITSSWESPVTTCNHS